MFSVNYGQWLWAGNSLQTPSCYLFLPPSVLNLSMFHLAISSTEVFYKTTVPTGCCHPLPICVSINTAVWDPLSNESWQINSHYAISDKYELFCKLWKAGYFSSPSRPVKQQPSPVNVRATTFIIFNLAFRKTCFLKGCLFKKKKKRNKSIFDIYSFMLQKKGKNTAANSMF